ncbi:MAG: histidine kinase [Solirubrobacteraceae bacterium]|nr:histidine kinase [Patulibacter sp.]
MSADPHTDPNRRRLFEASFFAPLSPFRRVEGGASPLGDRGRGADDPADDHLVDDGFRPDHVGVVSPFGYSLPEGLRTNPKAGAVWGSVWLIYLAPAFAHAVDEHHHPLARQVLGVALLAAFVVLYVTTLIVGWDRGARDGWTPARGWNDRSSDRAIRLVALLVATSLLCVLVVGEPGVATLVFLSPIAAVVLPGRSARWGILAAVAAVTVIEPIAPLMGSTRSDTSDLLSTAFSTLMAGAITLGIRRMRVVMWELHSARMDAQRLATAEERVRIARDLHDVLGHSLTVISMRSQLAARLVERGEIDRAGAEIKAVEELSRSAMTDVREAVAGYRVRPFAAELAAAEATLGGAGLIVEVERPTEQLPAAGEEALAFVMREGVTNVLRHSSAGRCAIAVRHTPSSVVVELVDDGRGIGTPVHVIGGPDQPDAAGSDGNGLRGLAERLAAVGGTLSAGDAPTGGFVLRAEVSR